MLILTVSVQAVYYLITGVWPILSIDTFQKVTGPKTDLWLVKTVGTLFIVIGLALGVSAIRSEVHLPVVVLGVASAIAVTIIDVWYVSRGVISRIYLLDAVAEGVLLIGWGLSYWLG